MRSGALIRWSGLAAMVAGVLLAIADLLSLGVFGGKFSETAATGGYVLVSVLYMIATISLLLGLVGLYARQAEVTGPLGLVGFVVAFVGTALLAGFSWASLFIAPALATEAPEFLDAGPPPGLIPTFAIFAVGWLLLGIATLRGRVFPRWAAILLIVGAVLSFLPLAVSGIVLAVAVAWLGLHLFTGRDAAGAQGAARVS
jgi:hypothetical protein